jgi:hypothetical protein
MKRILSFAAVALTILSLANCTQPQPVVERHYYHETTRYVKPTSVTTYSKPAGVSGGYNSPEGFQAVTPPASYSR